MQDQNETDEEKLETQAPELSEVQEPSEESEEPAPKIPNQPSVEALIDNGKKELPPEDSAADGSSMNKIARTINDAGNILIALSANPTLDDLAAAIGLSLALNRIGKRATAIYSGKTPAALDFLHPEDTFESSTDALQDFVISIDKEKADHLRYKLDGDYVKIYITPYRARISEDDLEFSYGSFNIDLVVGLNIKNGTDLDATLREHGRVMHDAEVVNITTDTPGKFGEIEWSDMTTSSISEMIAKMLYAIDKTIVTKDEATALLTGIIAATDRFSGSNTTPDTMQIAASLMASGADQKLITEKISGNIEENPTNLGSNDETQKEEEKDDSALDISHSEEPAEPVEEVIPVEEPTPVEEIKPAEEPAPESTPEPAPVEEPAPAPTPDVADLISASEQPVSEFNMPTVTALPTVEAPVTAPVTTPATEPTTTPIMTSAPQLATEQAPDATTAIPNVEIKSEKVVEPNAEFATGLEEGSNKYGQMLEEALNELNGTEAPAATPTVTPEMSAPTLGESIVPEPIAAPITETPANPAASIAPSITPNPEINGVPEINYNMPMPGDELLPPPPAPPIDGMGALPPTPEATTPAPTSMPTPVTPAPEPAAPAAAPAPTDPSAFKIP